MDITHPVYKTLYHVEVVDSPDQAYYTTWVQVAEWIQMMTGRRLSDLVETDAGEDSTCYCSSSEPEKPLIRVSMVCSVSDLIPFVTDQSEKDKHLLVDAGRWQARMYHFEDDGVVVVTGPGGRFATPIGRWQQAIEDLDEVPAVSDIYQVLCKTIRVRVYQNGDRKPAAGVGFMGHIEFKYFFEQLQEIDKKFGVTEGRGWF